MKIMIVTPYFYPKVGGLENYALNIAKGLNQQGYEVFVVTTNHQEKKYVDEQAQGLRVIRLPISFNLSNTPINLRWYWRLKKIIKAEKPNVINAHTPVPFMADMALLAAGRIPTILTYHSGSMIKSSGIIDMILRAYEGIFLPLLLKKADRIATVYPEFINQKLRPRDKHKVFYAPPCIDPVIFSPGGSRSQKNQKFSLLFVGRIENTSEWKGLDILLQVVAELAALKDLRLRVVGPGDAIAGYTSMANRLGIADRVTFTGALHDAELTQAYRDASVLVVPSKTDSEAFGTVMIEAMACGTPVIASRIGGIPNVINATKGGILVRSNNVAALAKTIRELSQDPAQLTKLAKSGLEAVSKKFIWQSTTKAYADCITTLTAKQKPVIFQITPYYPPHLGGMENVVQELTRELLNLGENVEVITSDRGFVSSYVDPEPRPGHIYRLRTTEISHLPIIWALLPKLCTTPRRSIFHVHVAQAFLPEIALLSARLRRSMFIAHFHLDVAASGRFGFVFKLYKRTLFPYMLRHADRVFVFSETQEQLVINKYGVHSSRVAVIPNGVNLEKYSVNRSFKKSGNNLLYAGRLSPQKRVDLLLEAMQHINQNVQLSIVGGGELEKGLHSLASKLKLQNVHFRGTLKGTALVKAYKEADMFVLMSEREGMPLVLLEAMAAGLPVVASDVLGTHELMDGIGVLVANPSPINIAKTIQKNLSTTRLADLSQRSLNRAVTFSWPAIGQQIIFEYQKADRT